MKNLANSISWLFMPLTMPLLALFLVFYIPADYDYTAFQNSLYNLPTQHKLVYLNAFLVFGFVFPVVSLLILKATKMVDSIELEDQKQRNTPIFLTACYATMVIFILFKMDSSAAKISHHIYALAISGALMSFIFLIINQKVKISLHAGGVGLLLGFIFAYYLEQSLLVFWPIVVICILAGVVLSTRLYLQKHSTFELYLGLIIGFLITFSTDIISLFLWLPH